jgi:hypothetical protein
LIFRVLDAVPVNFYRIGAKGYVMVLYIIETAIAMCST